MGEEVAVNSTKLVDAMRIWSGWGGMAPNRDESRLRHQLGAADAEVLLPLIRRLEEDFYSSDAHYVARDIAEMAKLAKDDFIRMHPTAADEIAVILAWCYTFDFR